MSLSMYELSVPVLSVAMSNLSHILSKGQAYAESKGIDPNVIANLRLYPDMLPLYKQVHIATDLSKSCAARLAGQEPPKYEDVEITFIELQARIDKVQNFLQGFTADQFAEAENREVSFWAGADYTMTGKDYLLQFTFPNVYFHITTAYDILRHNGVDLGKRDFLGGKH